ncbi:MAG: hypothetical protein ACXACP_12260 [Candidatus Hodarchaeales archaeon]|jgi:IS30 family transposase
MSNYNSEQQNRRPVILKGIRMGLKNSEIATQLNVNRWVVTSDLKRMRYHGDSELKQCMKKAQELQEKKPSITSMQDERFLQMTGMTFEEKTFQNMLHFYKPELMKILRSDDQEAEMSRLPKDIRRSLKKNGIISKFSGEITEKAQNFLPVFTRM